MDKKKQVINIYTEANKYPWIKGNYDIQKNLSEDFWMQCICSKEYNSLKTLDSKNQNKMNE